MADYTTRPITINGRDYEIPAYSVAVLEEVALALGCEEDLEAMCTRIARKNPRDFRIVTTAVLKAGGHDVPQEAIRLMPWQAYVEQVLPIIFEVKKDVGEQEARPQKRAKASA